MIGKDDKDGGIRQEGKRKTMRGMNVLKKGRVGAAKRRRDCRPSIKVSN